MFGKRFWVSLGILSGVLFIGFVMAQGNRGLERTAGGQGPGWAGGQQGMHASPAWRRSGRGPGMMGVQRWALRQLDLTDEQWAGVRSLAEQFRIENRSDREEMRQIREQLRAATLEGQFDEALVTELANQEGDLIARRIVARQRLQHEIYMLLTPDQQEAYTDLMNNARQRRAGRMRSGQ